MKIFVSQPMAGLTDEQILADHEEVVNKLKELFGNNIEVKWCNDDIVEGKGRLWYWGRGLQEMDGCDIYCNVEHMYANGVFNGCQVEETAAQIAGLSIIKLKLDNVKVIQTGPAGVPLDKYNEMMNELMKESNIPILE